MARLYTVGVLFITIIGGILHLSETSTHPETIRVAYGPPAQVKFETELITDTAGYQKTGGQGRCSWGFNHTNIVRHGEHVYALCWRDDLRRRF